jgi:O-antigen ligase
MLLICALATYSSAYVDGINRLYLEPTTFTGRGQIWTSLLMYWKDHPIFGSGFESFWNIGGSSPIFMYGHGYVTTITVGHNGYIDLLATVGLPGTLLIVWAVLLWPLLRIISSERVDNDKGALLCAMVLFCMGHNITESSLFERDAFIGVFAIFAAAFASYSLPKARLKREKTSGSPKSGDALITEMKRRTMLGFVDKG